MIKKRTAIIALFSGAVAKPGSAVKAILFREGEYWVGQCIEYDICTHANNLTELHKKLELTLQLERDRSIQRHGTPFAGIPRAPHHFEEMWWRRWQVTLTPAEIFAALKQS